MLGVESGTTLEIVVVGDNASGVDLGMIGEGEIVGADVVEIVRVHAVSAIAPIPINNLKYFTVNLSNYRF